MATEEAQLAAQDHAQRQAHLKQQCISTGGGPAAGGGGGGTRNTAVLTVAAACHNTPYAGKMCCIMYNTYYIMLCINMYYVLVHPDIRPNKHPNERNGLGAENLCEGVGRPDPNCRRRE